MDLGQQYIRSVSVQSTLGSIEGTLASSGMLRLLDDLNVVSRVFLTIHEPLLSFGPWTSSDEPLSINKSSVLFVKELAGCPPPPGNRRVSNHFSRASIELLMQDHAVRGFVHVPQGGDPITRMNQGNHSFVALTSVSVVGPGCQFATPFLAINRAHILAARPIPQLGADPQFEPEDTDLAAPLDDPAGC